MRSRNGASDWTMVLYPGKIERDTKPDLSKLIKLDSMTYKAQKVSNVTFDFNVGHGKLANRYVLVWQFGTIRLAGALS